MDFFLLKIPSVTANINASCQLFYFKLVIYIIFDKPLIRVILRVSVNFKLVVVHYFQVSHISFIKNIKYSIVSGGQHMIRSKSLALLKSILLLSISNTFLFLCKFFKNLSIAQSSSPFVGACGIYHRLWLISNRALENRIFVNSGGNLEIVIVFHSGVESSDQRWDLRQHRDLWFWGLVSWLNYYFFNWS
jgi:hypothetical protein